MTGDLSRIEDNTRLNSLVSHELMTVNENLNQHIQISSNVSYLWVRINQLKSQMQSLVDSKIDRCFSSGNKLNSKKSTKQ